MEGNQSSIISGAVRPNDMFSSGNAEFLVQVQQGDHFIIHRDHVIKECSGLVDVDAKEKNTLNSPNWPKLDNGSLITECRWLLTTNKSNTIDLQIKSLNLNDTSEVLVINNGPNFDSSPLYQVTSSMTLKALDRVIVSSGKNMMVSFKDESHLSHFQLDIQGLDNGQYLKNSGHIYAKPSSSSLGKWLLDAEENCTAVLQFNQSLSSLKAFSLYIYDDFSLKSKLITTITNINVWYPIVSTTSRMMIMTNSFGEGSFNAEFSSSFAGCMHMSQGSSDSYVLSKNCNSSCSWIIPPMSYDNSDLLLDLRYISLSENDTVEVKKLDDKAILAKALPNVSHVPQLAINPQKGAYVNINRGVCSKQPNDSVILIAQANYLPSCSGNIILNVPETKILTSPNFPNTYPLYSQCQTILKTFPAEQLLHLSFKEFQLASNHSLSIGNETSSKILTGSVLPTDLFYTNDVVLTFNSDSSLTSLISSVGYALNVTSTDCGAIVSAKTGNISTAVNKALCIWKISVPAEKDTVNSILFTVKKIDKVENYELKIYDGPTVRNKTVNITDNECWSRTDTIIVIYKLLNPMEPGGQITINFQTKSCDKSMQCTREHICLHPDWLCNGHDDCGDDTDERHCVPAPFYGISRRTFGLVCAAMLIIGCGLVFLIKYAIKKYQGNRYNRLGGTSVIE